MRAHTLSLVCHNEFDIPAVWVIWENLTKEMYLHIITYTELELGKDSGYGQYYVNSRSRNRPMNRAVTDVMTLANAMTRVVTDVRTLVKAMTRAGTGVIDVTMTLIATIATRETTRKPTAVTVRP